MKAFDKLCEVQSDKATVEITSRYDGVIAELHHEVGGIVKVGSSLLDMIQSGAAAAAAAPASSHSAPQASSSASAAHSNHHASSSSSSKVQTTPAVRRIAKENNVDLSQVRATGPKGRITKEDVQLYLKGGRVSPAAPPAASPATKSSVSESTSSEEDIVVPIRGMQRLMVKSMTAANQVPHLTLCEEVIFDNLKALRSQLKQGMDKKGIKLSYLPFIIKATSLALSQYPQLNATVNESVTAVTQHAAHNIGVAMDTPKGLIVPVIKNVQKKSILQIAQDLATLQVRQTLPLSPVLWFTFIVSILEGCH